MTGVVLTAWSASTPFGVGRAAYADGVAAGVPVPPESTSDEWADAKACVVPDFDIVERLGRKGTGSMDRASALAITTLGEAHGEVGTDARTGVVLGTTSGSTRTQFEFTRDSLTRRKPHFVNPAQMPFALMNSAAAQCAMWHGLTGPNSTVVAGRASGPAVLRQAVRWLSTGRASGVFAGAVEEHSGARAVLSDGRVLGEAACLLFLQTADTGNRPALAEVVALTTRVGEPRRALAECLRQALTGLSPTEVWGLARSGGTPEESEVERDVAGEVLGRQVDTVVRPNELVGDTGAASGVLGVAGLLAAAARDERARGRLAVTTSVDPEGMAGVVVLRLTGSPQQARGE